MNVRIFGYDVEITIGFFLTVLLLGLSFVQTNPAMLLVLALVLFFSVLVHEFGHALAFRAFGVRSSIRLHFLGGVTIPEIVLPLSRGRQVIVSFAGPLFGYLLALVAYGIDAATHIDHPGVSTLVSLLIGANLLWSTFNLVPVLPLDGGHILEAVLGPRRLRWTLLVSGVVAVLAALFFGLVMHQLMPVILFGMLGMQAFSRLSSLSSDVREGARRRERQEELEVPVDDETKKLLQQARDALDADDADGALAILDRIIPQASGRPLVLALNLAGWALLQKSQWDRAADVVVRLNALGAPEPALYGSVALARGELVAARNVLEAARFSGDNRKEIFGPLIQVYLRLGEPARAAALGLDCVESISSDDVRSLATMVSEQGAGSWAGRLLEALFRRERHPDDAFEAARAFARGGDRAKAIDLMKGAVAAGFDDASRIYADEALVGIEELDHVVPRPS
jgi:Zn-dependent protease